MAVGFHGGRNPREEGEPAGCRAGLTDGNPIVATSQCWRPRFDLWVGKIPWRRKWQPTPVLMTGKSHGPTSLVGSSPRGRKESGQDRATSLFPLWYSRGPAGAPSVSLPLVRPTWHHSVRVLVRAFLAKTFLRSRLPPNLSREPSVCGRQSSPDFASARRLLRSLPA